MENIRQMFKQLLFEKLNSKCHETELDEITTHLTNSLKKNFVLAKNENDINTWIKIDDIYYISRRYKSIYYHIFNNNLKVAESRSDLEFEEHLFNDNFIFLDNKIIINKIFLLNYDSYMETVNFINGASVRIHNKGITAIKKIMGKEKDIAINPLYSTVVSRKKLMEERFRFE